MGLKRRKAGITDTEPEAGDRPEFRHASGYADLAGVLGDHTLDAAQEAALTPPKGYRARSVAKVEAPHA
jgi:hypothetical protein